MCFGKVDVEVGRRGRPERLGDRVAQLAEPVEHFFILVSQELERPLVICEPVFEHDADDPPLLVTKQVVEPVRLARETRERPGW